MSIVFELDKKKRRLKYLFVFITFLLAGCSEYHGSISDEVIQLPIAHPNLRSRKSHWDGKIILVAGTSIEQGYPKGSHKSTWSYVTKAVERLGAECINIAVPNAIIRYADFNGSPVSSDRTCLRFTDLGSTVNYQTSMLDLIGTENEPDLFLFAYGVNDLDEDITDFNLFSPSDPYNAAMPVSSRNKNSYIGANNLVIDALKKMKPDARIAFITHFSEDSYDKIGKYKKCVDIVKALGKYWGVPVLDMASKTQWITTYGYSSITFYNPDGIHPASLCITESVDILATYTESFLREVR